MSRGPEAHFKSGINTFAKNFIYVESMANPYRRGTPDVYYEGPKGCLWVEYKFLKRIPSQFYYTDILSPFQVKWIKRAISNNVKCAIVVGHFSKGIIEFIKKPEQLHNELLKDSFYSKLINKRQIAEQIIKQITKKGALNDGRALSLA